MYVRAAHSLSALAALLLGAGVVLTAPTAASAETFEFSYTGTFNSQDALNLDGTATNFFSSPTSFTATAFFDDTSPNIVGHLPFPGFVAYAPTSVTLTVAGKTYDVTTYNQDAARGVTVAIYDQSNVFEHGRYGIGLLQDPIADGAGFVGDWSAASPDFSVSHLVSTTFTDYNGVGYGSGPGGLGNESILPIPLTDAAGLSYLLTLGNYDEEVTAGNTVNTASIVAVPEPGSVALLLASAGTTGLLAWRRRRK